MTVEEAKEYAKTMSYTEAVYNALQGRAVPYRKATKIKLNELLEIAKQIENNGSRCNTCKNNTDELTGECYECVKGIEDWYEPISELKGDKCDNDHDCEHCDWVECPLDKENKE